MPITLQMLRDAITPSKTTILLGAGASVPSGAPSGAALATKLWADVGHTAPQSEDLIDTASILERRHSRHAVVEVVRSCLSPLVPSGGLLGLPRFGWASLFSTNFDLLMERSYKASGIPLSTIRSNYDITNKENRSDTTLYKIHGCITQDRSLGDKSSMVLTEQDYEEFSRYRQSMFAMLQVSMLTNDVIIIGQSLRDRHLNDLVKHVLSTKQDGTPGEIYVLVYDQDDLRAPLLEDRGARIAFGSIDDFVHILSDSYSDPIVDHIPTIDDLIIPISLVSTIVRIEPRSFNTPNILKMFNGGPASYADIKAGATFERARYTDACDRLLDDSTPVVSIVGAAGVGKTTFGRQIASYLSTKGMESFEHQNDFPFLSQPWLLLEAELRSAGRRALLFLDECTRYLRQANMLIDKLATIEKPALKLVMTANAAQWTPRLKSPAIFKKGLVIELSRLENPELSSLVALLNNNKEVSDLVDKSFRLMPRGAQFSRLRERCGADMFVCLNNIFANQNLDIILLTEFEELEEGLKEYYRYVAALEAVGMRVHRQLIMRMLKVGGGQVEAVLNGLSGIIDEYDISIRNGIFGWSTRHIVIARKITEYKFSNYNELSELFHSIIDNINPAITIELQSIRELCDSEFGIGRLADTKTKQGLYRRLIDVAEGERIPWHRLIRELLDYETLEDVENAIRNAIDAVGSDGPIDRYKVRLLLKRAETTPSISDGDRLALVRKAYSLAETNIKNHTSDKFSYRSLCDVAIELVRRGESPFIVDEAILKFREAADRIMDPDMDKLIRRYEDIRSKM